MVPSLFRRWNGPSSRIHPIPSAFGIEPLERRAYLSMLTFSNPVPLGSSGGTGQLTPSVTAVVLPSPFVPGDTGIAAIALDNTGTGVAAGALGIQLFASTDGTVNNAVPLTAPGVAHLTVAVGKGKTRIVRGKFTIPADIAPGAYSIVAELTPGAGLVGEVSPTVVASVTTAQAVEQFGNVGARHNVHLIRRLAGDVKITYILAGPGIATLLFDANDNASIELTGTTAASNLIVNGVGLGTAGVLTGITSDGPVGHIIAPTFTLAGNLQLAGSVALVHLSGMTSGTITLGAGAASTLLMGPITNVSIQTGAGIALLNTTGWIDDDGTPDSVAAPWLGALIDKGNLPANLNLSGASAPGATALRVAHISGNVTSTSWVIGGNAAAVVVGGNINAGFSGEVTGNLRMLNVTGDFDADLSAGNIGTMTVHGGINSAHIFAGTSFGADGLIDNGDDVPAAGSINSIRVLGSVNASLIAAGLDAVDGIYLDGDDQLLTGSAIKAITIVKVLSDDSNVLAVSLPKRVHIAGLAVTPAGDPRFSL